jgi:hypothetical protein
MDMPRRFQYTRFPRHRVPHRPVIPMQSPLSTVKRTGSSQEP